MNKHIYILVIYIVSTTFIFAQKKSVGFAPFSYKSSNATEEAAANIYNYVVQAFHATQRFSVKDRLYGHNIVSNEQELTKNEIFLDGEVLVKKGKLENTEWMVSGKIMSANAVEREEGGYLPNISFFIRVYDVVTGGLVASEIISPTGRLNMSDSETIDEGMIKKFLNTALDKFSASSKEDAMTSGMTSLIPHIKSFVRENFPYEFYDFTEHPNESGIPQILVRGPEQMGAEKNQLFQVIHLEIFDFAGEKTIAKRVKGELKIVETAGKVLFLEPRNKSNASIIPFMNKHKSAIFLRESGKKANALDNLGSSKGKSKSKKNKKS